MKQWTGRYPGLVDVWPLTAAQSEVLAHSELPASLTGPVADSAYDTGQFQVVAHLNGQINSARLRQAAQDLVDRHPNLRTAVVPALGGGRRQVVVPRAQLPWRDVDFSDLNIGDRGTALDRLLAEDAAHRFDVAAPPLLRMTLVRTSVERCDLVVTAHHALLDGESVRPLLSDLLRLYDAGDDAGSLPAPRSGHRDVLTWLAGQDRDKAARVWADELEGIDGPTLLAPVAGRRTRRPVPVPAAEAGAGHPGFGQSEVRLSARERRQLSRCAAGLDVGVDTLVQGAWAIVLAGLTGRQDLLFGATHAGRPEALTDGDALIGPFGGTTPLRLRCAPEDTAARLLARLRDSRAALADHQHVATGLLQLAEVEGMFDTSVAYDAYPVGALTPAALGISSRIGVTGVRSHAGTPYALTVVAHGKPALHLSLCFQRHLFDQDAADAVALRLAGVLRRIAAEPSVLVGELSSLDGTEEAEGAAAVAGQGAVVHYPFERRGVAAVPVPSGSRAA
ncbi:condensation domain-containing protein [Streptomyces sp. NPDC059009]|uniref:condensation domain-containing protein n=1 Tax=Streptomyces sp. NPDC059009 TaxID=3346694 RepID=UPI0036B00DFB